MRIKRSVRLTKRRYSDTKGVTAFSDRSGHPYKYNQMVKEPGTGYWVHRKESDREWNIAEAYRDPVVPSDAQRVEEPTNVPSSAVQEVTSLYLSTNSTDPRDKLFIDKRGQEALEVS